jgi:hypothetical protein
MKTPVTSTVGLALVVSLAAPIAAVRPQPEVNPTGAAVLAFQNAVAEYVKIHNEAESKVPELKETGDPGKISAREAALAAAIQQLRPTARPGDIFVAEFKPVLLATVKRDFADRTTADRKAMVEEMPAKVTIAVNKVYPPAVPLATFPAKLLRALPDLPPELEYRIVGRDLILRDIKANLVADVARGVVPSPAR